MNYLEQILLIAVGLLQLANTGSNIFLTIVANKNKASKEILDSLKDALDTTKAELEAKGIVNKELRADNKQERAQREMMALQLVAAKRDYLKETGKEWHYVTN